MQSYRKIIPVLFFLIITGVNVKAQDFKAALKAGVSTSQISGDNLGGYNKAGLAAGGMVSLPLSEKFDIALEVLYIEKGSKRDSDPEKGDYQYYRLRLNYFEFPLMLKWNYSKRFTFDAGPTFGVLMKSSEEDEYGEIPTSDIREFNKTEVGIAGGMQVNFASKFSFVARIESSILAVRDHVSGETYRLNKGQYNAVLSFAFQYNFGKGSSQ